MLNLAISNSSSNNISIIKEVSIISLSRSEGVYDSDNDYKNSSISSNDVGSSSNRSSSSSGDSTIRSRDVTSADVTATTTLLGPPSNSSNFSSSSSSTQLTCLRCDLTDSASIDSIVRRHGPFDVYVHSIGESEPSILLYYTVL